MWQKGSLQAFYKNKVCFSEKCHLLVAHYDYIINFLKPVPTANTPALEPYMTFTLA